MYFSRSRSYPFPELAEFLNEVGSIVQQVRIEKENQYQYMQYIVQNIGIGLIAFDKEGRVDIVNPAAERILGIKQIFSVEMLDQVQAGLSGMILRMNAGEGRVVVINTNGKLQHLALNLSVFKIAQREISLLSLQDIKNELDEKEMESWQKLIRALTHEIINSITPVTSLTGTISNFFKSNSKVIAVKDLSDSTLQDAVVGIELIEERGKALIDFVSKFRSLTKLPTPKFEEVKIQGLLDGIIRLKKAEIEKNSISLNITISPLDLQITCDRGLIEQVLLNLLNNAVDAVANNDSTKERKIEIQCFTNENHRTVIGLSDNGCGITENLIDEIFVPFFTTKEHGSGIGLSLSRQIMRLHGGTISVKSKLGEGTDFNLIF